MSITSDILARVEAAAEALVGLGTEYGGLFPSMVDLDGVAMLERAPDPIEGQRSGDRSYRGCNLIHDEATLLTLHGLAKGRSRPDFAAAADRYVRRYATHCTETPTGLFPWGEHAFWDLDTDAIGDSHRQRDPTREAGAIHDHLRAAPFWLWEKILRCNPACVQSFADGLHYHWTDGEPREYIRHATIEQRRAHPRSARSCDFPRHGGFFICDWSFAYRAEPRRRTLDEIESIVDMHIMVQKEVADRLVATPNSKAYGRLGVMVAARAKAVKLFDVGPGAFSPPPKVESSVVRLSPLDEARVPHGELSHFAATVRDAFAMRRKTLRRIFAKRIDAQAIEACGISPSARAETLGVEEFLALSRAISATRNA